MDQGLERPYSGLAIVAFVLSLLWLGGLGSLAGAVLGGTAMSRARTRRQRGAGLAVAALVIGILGCVGTASVLGVSLIGASLRDQQQLSSEARQVTRQIAVQTTQPSHPTPSTPTTVPEAVRTQASLDAKWAAEKEAHDRALREYLKVAGAEMQAAGLAVDDDFLKSSGETYCSLMDGSLSRMTEAQVLSQARRGQDAMGQRMVTIMVRAAARDLCPK